MWRVCKSSKIKHPGGSGGFVLETKGRPRPATHLSGCFTTTYWLSKKKLNWSKINEILVKTFFSNLETEITC